VQLDATSHTLNGQDTFSTENEININDNTSPDLTTKSIILVKNNVIAPDQPSKENSPTNLNLNQAIDESIIDEDVNMLSTKNRDLKLEED